MRRGRGGRELIPVLRDTGLTMLVWSVAAAPAPAFAASASSASVDMNTTTDVCRAAYGSSVVTKFVVVAFAVVMSLLGAGCGQGGPPHSKLIHLTLPEGSTRNTEGRQPAGHEVWVVPKPYDDTVAHLRSQLPLQADFEGLHWSGAQIETNPPRSVWEWKKPDIHEFIRIDVSAGSNAGPTGPIADTSRSVVIIDRG